jgi:hypothetical protein
LFEHVTASARLGMNVSPHSTQIIGLCLTRRRTLLRWSDLSQMIAQHGFKVVEAAVKLVDAHEQREAMASSGQAMRRQRATDIRHSPRSAHRKLRKPA